jgi:hypothetical protein
MAGRAGEAVVTALKFQVGIADAAAEQADEGKASGPVGARLVVYFHTSVFQVYGQHDLFQALAFAEPQDGLDDLANLYLVPLRQSSFVRRGIELGHLTTQGLLQIHIGQPAEAFDRDFLKSAHASIV